MKILVHIVIYVILCFLGYLTGFVHGQSQIMKMQYKTDMANLIHLSGSGVQSDCPAIFELIKIRCYYSAGFVPDSWLQPSLDQGPINISALHGINPIKDSSSLEGLYESVKVRLERRN